MIWLLFAFLSAALLGCYDAFKKHSLSGNDILTVLFLNTVFCSIIFLPMAWYAPFGGWEVQRYVLLKSFIVLSSWICGYYAMANLPLTLVGPLNASRPVLVLMGALLFYGERLNMYQWIGVSIAIISFFMLKKSGSKEGIDFRSNGYVLCLVIAVLLGALSGLYDKYLMAPVEEGGMGLNRLTVQAYFNFYQMFIMGVVLIVTRYREKGGAAQAPRFQWRWTIPLISIFICMADMAYFYSLSLDGAMISVVSMVRRSSVVVSFLIGAFVLHERNVKSKAWDLLLVLLGMFFLYLGAR